MNYRDIENVNLTEFGDPLHIGGRRNQRCFSVSSFENWMNSRETR